MQSSTRAIHPQEYEYIEGGDFRVPLKQVMRQTLLIDGSRRENSAEHSWHLAVAAPSTIQGALAYGITHLTDNLYFFIYIEIFSPTLSTLSKQ
jgi:hypothetical protein